MQEGIIIQNQNLPNTIEDLAKFVLVGREKLTAVRANIRAIDKLQLAEDVREQKKEEEKERKATTTTKRQPKDYRLRLYIAQRPRICLTCMKL